MHKTQWLMDQNQESIVIADTQLVFFSMLFTSTHVVLHVVFSVQPTLRENVTVAFLLHFLHSLNGKCSLNVQSNWGLHNAIALFFCYSAWYLIPLHYDCTGPCEQNCSSLERTEEFQGGLDPNSWHCTNWWIVFYNPKEGSWLIKCRRSHSQFLLGLVFVRNLNIILYIAMVNMWHFMFTLEKV